MWKTWIERQGITWAEGYTERQMGKEMERHKNTILQVLCKCPIKELVSN